MSSSSLHSSRCVPFGVGLNYCVQKVLGTGLSVRGKFGVEDYLLRVSVEITGVSGSGVGEVKLGTMNFLLLRVGNAYNDGIPMDEMFDYSDELAEIRDVVFDQDFDDYAPAIASALPYRSPWDDLLIIEQVVIEPIARHRRLGLSAIMQVIRDCSAGCSLVILKAFPLQFSAGGASMIKGQFHVSESEAFRKLRAHYSRLGFRRIGRTDYRAYSTELRMPDEVKLKLVQSVVFSPEEVAMLRGVEEMASAIS